MPERPVNAPLTPDEAMQSLFRQVESYLFKGICEKCALILVCDQYRLQYGRVLMLWLDRDLVSG